MDIWKTLGSIIPISLVPFGSKALFSKSWANFSKAVSQPKTSQKQALFNIISKNKTCLLGKKYNFDKINSIKQFKKNVPICNYGDIKPYMDRVANGEKNIVCFEDVIAFARTSGTTTGAKIIPVTNSYIENIKTKRNVWMRQLAISIPSVIKGTLLTIHDTGFTDYTKSGLPIGSLTTSLGNNYVGKNVTSGFDKIPKELFKVENYNDRYYAILRFALEQNISLMTAINPSTLVTLLDKLNEFSEQLEFDLIKGTLNLPSGCDFNFNNYSLDKRPDIAKRLKSIRKEKRNILATEVWPFLSGACCWTGGSAKLYIEALTKYLPEKPFFDFGYAASEGYFAIPLEAGCETGSVLLPYGTFFEFAIDNGENIYNENGETSNPEETILINQLQKDGIYRVIITGLNGLYRYDMKDLIQVTGFYKKTPLIRFLRRCGDQFSFTGEKLTAEHFDSAIKNLQDKFGLKVVDYIVSPDFNNNQPRYKLYIEMISSKEKINNIDSEISKFVDLHLSEINVEYMSKRKSLRLNESKAYIVREGTFLKVRDNRVKQGAFEHHYKLKRFIMPSELSDWLDVDF